MRGRRKRGEWWVSWQGGIAGDAGRAFPDPWIGDRENAVPRHGLFRDDARTPRMERQPFHDSPFADFAREEDFNARVSEAIRTSMTRANARRDEPGEPDRLIDFEDQTTIALGVPRRDSGGWIVEFEVGGVGRFLENPADGTPREDRSPCVCRGALRIEKAEDTNSAGGPFHAKVLETRISFAEELHRP